MNSNVYFVFKIFNDESTFDVDIIEEIHKEWAKFFVRMRNL